MRFLCSCELEPAHGCACDCVKERDMSTEIPKEKDFGIPFGTKEQKDKQTLTTLTPTLSH